MNKLIDEHPLILLPSLAIKIGVDCAIALQRLDLRQQWQEAHGDDWVTCSLYKWRQRDFPFWSLYKIGCIFRRLTALPFVEVKKHNAVVGDQTNSYRINRGNFAEWKKARWME